MVPFGIRGDSIQTLILFILLTVLSNCAPPEHTPATSEITPIPKPGPGPNGPLIAEVKFFLGKCDSCHALEGVPSFKEWPIGNAAKHQRWVVSIRRSMGFASRPRSMPPRSNPWQPTPEQLATLKQWYDLDTPID